MEMNKNVPNFTTYLGSRIAREPTYRGSTVVDL